MFKNEFINFQDRLFLVKKIIKEEHQPNIEVWKEHLCADTVLKKDNLLYFLEAVPDLNIVNDL
jgi:TFIIF-interacting CTD phosphatase-like protein